MLIKYFINVLNVVVFSGTYGWLKYHAGAYEEDQKEKAKLFQIDD